MSTQKTVVVTGANRGIGFALAAALSAQGHRVIATARDPENATELKALKNVSIVKAEMTNLASLKGVAEEIAKLAPQGVDELWNNAGQSQNRDVLSAIEPESFIQELTVNVAAPSAMTKYLLPLLRKKDTKKIIFISSAMGSETISNQYISENLKGLPLAETEDFSTASVYCTTKAALNMQALGWHSDLFPEGFNVIAIHPGWIQTRMTGTRPPLTTDVAIPQILKTVKSKKRSENFVLTNYDGNFLPW